MWNFLLAWSFEPTLAFGLLAVALAYAVGVHRVNKAHPRQPWPVKYTVLFYSGLGLLLFVTLGPIGTYDGQMFWAHMIQHLVVMMLAAPLLLLGQPVLLILRVSSPAFRTRYVVPILRSRLVRFLTHPVVSWVIFASVIVLAHFTHFYEWALEHDSVHLYIEHPMFMAAALIYFYPLVGIGPGASSMPPAHKIVSLLAMMVPETMTGFAIYMARGVLYPYYATVTDRPIGPGTAIADQRLGGAFMWSTTMAFSTIWVVYAGWQWLKSEEVQSKRVDLEIARETRASGSQ